MVFFSRRTEQTIPLAVDLPMTELIFNLSKVPPGVTTAANDPVTQPMPSRAPPVIVATILFRLHTELPWRELDRTSLTVVKLSLHRVMFSETVLIDTDLPALQVIKRRSLSSNRGRSKYEAPPYE
jgi:hypothetical protein